MPFNVKIFYSNEIDYAKYDNCIALSNGHIYAKKLYLDTITKNWFAIVINDYEAVMPICYNKKLGIKYCYTPAFIQQLGIVHHKNFIVTNELLHQIEACLFSFLKYGDIQFNHCNSFAKSFTKPQTNFTLNLKQPYINIYEKFSNDVKRNIKKGLKENIFYCKEESIDVAIELHKSYYQQQKLRFNSADFSNLKSLCLQLYKTQNCFTRTIKNKENKVLSIGVFLKDNNRIYNIANTTTAIGRSVESNYLLLHFLFEEFSEQNLLFDFEGSDLKGVKEFYQKFGAINEPYYHWHFNKLPWWLKLIKK